MEVLRTLGARPVGGSRWEFTVWAPLAERVEVELVSSDGRRIPLVRDAAGYFQATIEDLMPGDRYLYVLDGEKRRPDPASRHQPEGVHGPSELVSPQYPWTDGEWRGLSLRDYFIYELHVGTFSEEGTFAGVRKHLDHLGELGVTAVEIMPVAQFPGRRNWGYDGVLLFAVQNSYGGPQGLRALVDECHQRGLAVILDVVYNHLGPEGNYLRDFGPYFTDRYHTPWGDAVNFDGEGSDAVRNYFIQNALYWVREFHVDALRLDAVHAMLDLSATHFLEELGTVVKQEGAQLGREVHLIAESDQNNPRIVTPAERGGYGLDGVWADDFHHVVHARLTGESGGYYADYGRADQLERVLEDGFAFTGQYSKFRGRRHGRSARQVPPESLCVCIQNHDQVGNRMLGERLDQLTAFASRKLAAATLLLSPYTPLLFMGEEYGESAPFQYFIDHGDPELVAAVREGRKREFREFAWDREPPDPQSEETFRQCRLNLKLKNEGRHASLFGMYRRLIGIAKQLRRLGWMERGKWEVTRLSEDPTLALRYGTDSDQAVVVLHYGESSRPLPEELSTGSWRKVFDSSDPSWGESEENMQPSSGEIAPFSASVFSSSREL